MSFSLNGRVSLSNPDDTYQQVNYKHLPAGAYAVVATVNLDTDSPFDRDLQETLSCYVNNGQNSIGDATARVFVPDGQDMQVSLTMNGGVQYDGAGGAVSVFCTAQDGGAVLDSQVMFIRTAGYF